MSTKLTEKTRRLSLNGPVNYTENLSLKLMQLVNKVATRNRTGRPGLDMCVQARLH